MTAIEPGLLDEPIELKQSSFFTTEPGMTLPRPMGPAAAQKKSVLRQCVIRFIV
jgi:hypothetical protein